MKLLLFLQFILIPHLFFSQEGWEWTVLDTMPKANSNNAVCAARVGNNRYVYSFTGIDTSKLYSGIHLHTYKYDVNNNTWETLADVPDTLGKIAAGASYVNDRIYVIGGYHVLQNGTEVSSNKVHVFNAATDTWEADANPLPIPIDDHVQAVWRDSLIYVVTGWSNTGNVPNVQLFNPLLNSWTLATEVPNSNTFRSFGASGYILGDTIYYHGGVSGISNFVARRYFRKGVINPNNPTEISWTLEDDAPGEAGYRSACAGTQNTIFWVGGASVGYNYDGVAYNGTGGVDPESRILMYNTETSTFTNFTNAPFEVMDLRGIASIGGGSWIIAGGMDTSQTVSNRTFLLFNEALSNINEITQPPFFEVSVEGNQFLVRTEFAGEVSVYDIQGSLLFEKRKLLADLKIDKAYLKANMLIFIFNDGSNVPVFQKIVVP